MGSDRNQLTKLLANFDSNKFTYHGVEAWSARDLQALLGYQNWQNFRSALTRAMDACAGVGRDPEQHFVPLVGEPEFAAGRIFTGVSKKSGRGRPREELILSRLGAYLTAMNGDPTKEAVAFAQAYFATQTRKMELLVKHMEELDRLSARKQLSRTEKELNGALYQHGVDDKGFAIIRSRGDRALFGGRTTADMKARLGCPEDQPLANHLQTVLIRAKDLAAEMTAFNTKARSLQGVTPIGDEHVRNNTNVRGALRESGIVPEDVKAAEDTRKVASRHKRAPRLVAKEADCLPVKRD